MRSLLIAAICLALLWTPIDAVETVQMQSEQFGMDKLEQGVPEDAIMPAVKAEKPGDLTAGLQEILKSAIPEANSSLTSALKTAVPILALMLLCSIVLRMDASFSKQAVTMAGVLAITLISISNLQSMIGLGEKTLLDLQNFTSLLLPTLAAATAASGGTLAANTIYISTVLITNMLITAINHFLIPLLYAFLVVSAASAMIGNHTLKHIKRLCKWILTGGVKLVVLLFTGYLSVTGIISGASDEAATKATKLALSSMVPVVGGMISDASETVLISAKMLKNAAGIFGMLAVISICLVPLIRIGLQYVILKLTAAVSGVIGETPLVDLVESVGDAMGCLVGLTGGCGFMLLVSCVCSIKAVGI